jgi:predicted AlkP superfamily phosphohydrolase/phosphomutase
MLLKVYRQLLKANIRAKLTTHVNQKSSKVFAHGFGIYVKEKELVDYVILMLKKTSFIGGVWKKEELHSGKQLEAMPDLIVVPKSDGGFAFRGDIVAPKPMVRRNFSSNHPNGIVIVQEDGVQPSSVDGIRVYDVVPTILDFLGLDIPKDTDGEVIDLSSARIRF